MSSTPNYYRPGDPLDKIVPFLCPVCGGINDARQYALLRLASGVCLFTPYKKCDCPPELESAQKHDGIIGRYSVRPAKRYHNYPSESNGILVTFQGGADFFFLPEEALSLLAWLQQERETLERLAKEQEP